MRVKEVRIGGPTGQDSHVAIEKRLSPRTLREPEAVEGMQAEARLLAALLGRVTPKLVGVGEDDQGPWLQMEKVPFPTLEARLATGIPVAPDWFEKSVRAAFSALADLHEAEDARGPLTVVHADLSPANIAIDDDGLRVIFLDLELACWRDGPARDGAFRGTVAYCAPEVARGEVPEPRSDLFALAASLLHSATGVPPRTGPSLAAMVVQAAEVSLVDEHLLAFASRSAAHAALVACLAHDAADRPHSARAASLALVV